MKEQSSNATTVSWNELGVSWRYMNIEKAAERVSVHESFLFGLHIGIYTS